MPEGHHGAVGVGCALAELGHGAGHRLKHRPTLLAFEGRALDAGEPRCVGLGDALHLEAKAVGGVGEIGDFGSCLGALALDGSHGAVEAVEVGGHAGDFSHAERCSYGAGNGL